MHFVQQNPITGEQVTHEHATGTVIHTHMSVY